MEFGVFQHNWSIKFIRGAFLLLRSVKVPGGQPVQDLNQLFFPFIVTFPDALQYVKQPR